jgi:hypothetical protein
MRIMPPEDNPFQSWGKTDHLTYLKDRSIFEGDDSEENAGKALVCAACGHPVTTVSEKVEVLGRHDHAFPYYHELVRVGCFRNAAGCVGVRGISHGYSWFRGYGWQIQVCKNCHTQLGWKYISREDAFYGLVLGTLREAEAPEASSTAD